MAALASLKCAVLYARDCLRFERTRNPFVYTPGDHEWTYCHRLPNRSPEEADLSNRPGHLRSTFFSDGRDPTIGNEAEWRAHNEANIAWLEGTFDTTMTMGSRLVTRPARRKAVS